MIAYCYMSWAREGCSHHTTYQTNQHHISCAVGLSLLNIIPTLS
jgi:hypothetical protein